MLVLGDHLGYDAGVVHGVTMYFVSVLPALKQTGLPFSVCFLRRPHAAARQLADAGIEPRFLSAARMNPLVIFRIARMVREQHIGLIHAVGLKATLIAKIVGRMTGARVIVHVHDLFGPRGPIKWLHHRWARPGDLGVCVAAAARQAAIEAYGIDAHRVRVVHNGIELARFLAIRPDARQRVRAELRVDAAAPVIGMIGRFYPVKGHRSLIAAMARVVAVRDDARLVLVGDGPLRGECEQLGRELGLEKHIQFIGQRSDIPELLSAFDLVSLPSELEGLPLTAIESLAAGRPVVAFDVGGVPEVVTDGVDGRVVPAADVPALAAALLELLNDAEQLARFGANARRGARRFSVERHVRRLLECYREALA